MRVLLCGAPSYDDKLRMTKILREFDPDDTIITVQGRHMHGVDELASEVCFDLDMEFADASMHLSCVHWRDTESIWWRNEKMLSIFHDEIDYNPIELVIAFCADVNSEPESIDMYLRCKERGIRFLTSVFMW